MASFFTTRTSKQSSKKAVVGLANTGNSCFLNSVVQAIAALNTVSRCDGKVHEILAALIDLVNGVSGSSSRSRPSELMQMLEMRFSGGQEDAQECFQMILQALDDERAQNSSRCKIVQNPFLGLSLSRFVCRECLWSESLKTETFEILFCTLPMTAGRVSLMDVIQQGFAIESIDDAFCPKCSALSHLNKLKEDLDAFSLADDGGKSRKKSRRKAEERKKLMHELEQDLNDENLGKTEVKIPKASSLHTKQTMIARPPENLVIHFNRSAMTSSGYSVKNPCQIDFTEFVDLGKFVLGDDLSLDPLKPISQGSAWSDEWSNVHRRRRTASRNGSAPLLEVDAPEDRRPLTIDELSIYRLQALIVHLGSHDRGHYITLRRRPRTIGSGAIKVEDVAAVNLAFVEQACRDFDDDLWYRVSDENVSVLGIEQILDVKSSFMLFYEKLHFELVVRDHNPHGI